jgi:class 3 adenylate cyclase/predicted ATPase
VGDKFCRNCGTPQIVKEETQEHFDPNRRQITALFCDLVGSTDLSTMMDAEEFRDLIADYQAQATKVIERYGGYISNFMGDGILVLYSYPIAQEDAAERAIRTALDLVDEIGKVELADKHELKVRIGVATGVTIVGDLIGARSSEQRAVVGETPNLAARLQNVAKPNQVVIAQSTYQLVKGLFETTDLGKVQLKGFPDPQSCWLVDGAKVERSRFKMLHTEHLTGLVGRDEEMRVLTQRLAAGKQGDGQVVLISGDPGIGKSRIIQEVTAQAKESEFNIIPFNCSPIHRNTALYPIIQVLQGWLNFPEHIDSQFETLEAELSNKRINSAESLSLMASLFSVEVPEERSAELELALAPQVLRTKTHELLSDWLTSTSESNPVVTIWEDLHWADPSTLEVLTLIVEKTGSSKQMQLFTFRPEFRVPWESRSFITTMVLRPLDADQTEMLIREFAEREMLPEDIVDSLVSRSDGVPLFAEELAQMAVESSKLVGRPLTQTDIPSSLHDSLVSRLDNLGTTRKFAQVASVLGRNFTFDLLPHLFEESESAIAASLGKLVDTQILTKEGSDQTASYQFRHALIQDTAYKSMLKKDRKQVHLQIAEMFESEAIKTTAQQPEVLAHHFTEAESADRAMFYWEKAGSQSLSRFDNVEAMNHFQRALDQLDEANPSEEQIQTELNLLLVLGVTLTITRGFGSDEVGQVYGRARDICLGMENDPRLYLMLNGLFRYYIVRGEVTAAHVIAERLMTMAEESKDKGELVYAHQVMSLTFSMMGKIDQSREHLDAVGKHYVREDAAQLAEMTGADALIAARTNGAVTALFLQGDYDLDKQWIEECIQMARELGNPFEIAWTLNYGAIATQQFGDVEDTLDKAEECIEVSIQYEMPNWLSGGKILKGWCTWKSGNTEQGLQEMREGLFAWQQTGAGIFIPYYKSLLLSALAEEGQLDEGFEVYHDICEYVKETEELWWIPEVERLRGELLAQQEGTDKQEAIDAFQKAIDMATAQGEPSLVLRSLTSLARLEPSEENRVKLQECLSGISQKTTTVDIEEARKLVGF